MDGTVGKITQLTQRPSEEWLKRYREGVIDMAQAVTEAYEGEEEKVNTIEFYAEVAKVQTTVDGVRVVLDLGEPGVKHGGLDGVQAERRGARREGGAKTELER